MTTKYWLPTRPYSVIDSINRTAAATGSMRYAQLTSHADYNGHYVTVSWNDYRGYWVTEYHWGERVVLARGSLESCLRAAREEYDRGALGTTVQVGLERGTFPNADGSQTETTPEQLAEWSALCERYGFVPYSAEAAEAHDATWMTPLHEKVGHAFEWERMLGIPAISFLANSKTVEEYEAKVKEAVAMRRQRKPV